MEVALPVYTRILIATSEFTRDYWYVVARGVDRAARGGFCRWMRSPERASRRWDRLSAARLPVFGNLVRMLAMAASRARSGHAAQSGVPAAHRAWTS